MTQEDDVLRGFNFLKGVVARWGPDMANVILTAADRAVEQGLYPDKAKAITAVEELLRGK